MSLAEALAIGAMFAAFETVAGTLIAFILGGVFLPTAKNDIYRAAVLTSLGAVFAAFLYQAFDPTFLTVTTYLGMGPEQRAQHLFSHMVFPLLRFAAAQVVIDLVIARFAYQFTYQDKAEGMFTGTYSVLKISLSVSIWILFIVPAFAAAL